MEEATKHRSPRIYLPLADSDEIRLLLLHPGSSDDTIKCTIRHVKLSKKLQYEALSYMWGPKDYKSIEIDGVVCDVGENLYQALLHLRRHDNDNDEGTLNRFLWIDALCINQNDISERNHQVTQMGTIYKRATRTVVWLGLHDSSTPDAVSFLVEYGKMKNPWWEYQKFFDDSLITEDSIRILKAVASLCLREYWTRLWIIQEILLVPEIRIQCGQWWFKMADLGLFFGELKSHSNDGPMSGSSPTILEVLQEKRSIIKTIKNCTAESLVMDWKSKDRQPFSLGKGAYAPRPLIELCAEYGGAKCENQLDKVFGLLGITLPCCAEAVPVDYYSSLTEISQKVLLHHVKVHTGDYQNIPKRPNVLVEFQTQLQIDPDDFLSQILDLLESRSIGHRIATIERGYESGYISYVSPRLYSGLDVLKILNQNLTPKLYQQIDLLNTCRQNDDGQFPPLTKEADFAPPLKGSRRRSYLIRGRMTLMNGNPDLTAPRHSKNPRKFFVPYRASLEKCITQLLLDLQKHISMHSTTTSSGRNMLSFRQRGLICIVPSNQPIRKAICQIDGQPVLVPIIRDCEANWKTTFLGRVVNIFGKTSIIHSDPSPGLERACSHATYFELDLAIFQLIDLSSNTIYPDIYDDTFQQYLTTHRDGDQSFVEIPRNPSAAGSQPSLAITTPANPLSQSHKSTFTPLRLGKLSGIDIFGTSLQLANTSQEIIFPERTSPWLTNSMAKGIITNPSDSKSGQAEVKTEGLQSWLIDAVWRVFK